MNCSTYEERIDALIDGELDAQEAARVEAHVGSCAACATELAAGRALKSALGGIADTGEGDPLPPGLDKLGQKVRLGARTAGDKPPRIARPPKRVLPPAERMLVAAAILFALSIPITWVLHHRYGGSPGEEPRASIAGDAQPDPEGSEGGENGSGPVVDPDPPREFTLEEERAIVARNREAAGLVRQGRHQEALEIYESMRADYEGHFLAERAEYTAAWLLTSQLGNPIEGRRRYLDFAKRVPANSRADDALLAAAELSSPDHKIRLYQRILEDYPDGNVAPAAGLAYAELLLSRGEEDQAREMFRHVGGAYPDTEEGRIAQERVAND